MKKFKKLVCSAIAALVMVTSADAFQKRSVEKDVYLEGSDGNKYAIVFATGAAGGTWDKGALNLQAKTGLDRKTGSVLMRVENGRGSEDNAYYMESKQANATFMQGDKVPALIADANFKKGKVFIKLADDTAEFVQLIMRKGMDEDDLQGKIKGRTPVVFAGQDGSGGRISAYNIKDLESNYIYEVLEGEAAEDLDYDITALTALREGEIDAIIKTSKPIPGKDAFGNLVSGMKDVHLVDFDDKDLNDSIKLPNGKEEPIYEFREFTYETGFFNHEAESPATVTYLIIDKKNMSKRAYKALLNAVVKAKYNPFPR